jgi:DNA-binding NarL/FixJ family response regulator
MLELAAEDDLQAANAFKQPIPSVPLLLVAKEVSLENEKEALAHGVNAVFPKEDDPTTLALNVRALYDISGRDREGET